MKQHEPINNILAKFVQQQAGSGIKEAADRTCPKCGISFREFRAQGLLGCPHDYVAFSKHLTPLIERAHGAGGEHVGKRPRRAGGSAGKQSTLRQLHRKLSDAVEREDYEAAAKLRDQIKVLEANAD